MINIFLHNFLIFCYKFATIYMSKKDITTAEDIALWQLSFYKKLLANEITAPKFENLDLPAHMPRVNAFWEFVLLDKSGYTTNVFDKHIHLNLEKIHFEKWMQFFKETTNEMFEGANANIALERVKLIATTFYHKISGEYRSF